MEPENKFESKHIRPVLPQARRAAFCTEQSVTLMDLCVYNNLKALQFQNNFYVMRLQLLPTTLNTFSQSQQLSLC